MKRFLPQFPLLCAVLLGAVACASAAPPVDRLNSARDAVALAEGAGAYEHAPLELHMARERLDQAREALADEEYARARRLAEIATAHAELARRRAEAVEQERTAEALRSEIELVGGGSETTRRP